MKYTVVFTEGKLSLEVGTFTDLETAVKYGNDNACGNVNFEVRIVK